MYIDVIDSHTDIMAVFVIDTLLALTCEDMIECIHLDATPTPTPTSARICVYISIC